MLHGFIMRTLKEYRVPYEEESPTPDNDGTGRGCLRTDVIADNGALISENDDLVHV